MVVIPALPDTERTTSYSVTTTTDGPFDVEFALYGNGTDPENWIEVYQDGVLLDSAAWTLDSPTGTLATLARPITDARVTLVDEIEGTVSVPIAIKISGRRRPRRTSQLTEGSGIPAHDFNQIETDNVAILREHHDRFSRMAAVPPGETQDDLPPLSDRASKWAYFDTDGNLTARDLGDLVPAAVTAASESLVFPTVDAFTAASVPTDVGAVLILGYGELGTGQIVVRRVDSEPADEAKLRSADRYLSDGSTDATDGGWWEYVIPETGVDLDSFGASDGVAFHTALANAIEAGVRHVIISKSYNVTAGVTIDVEGMTLEWRGGGVLNKQFSGLLFDNSGANLSLLRANITANGATYTGNIIDDASNHGIFVLGAYCSDLADGGYFYEEKLAAGGTSGAFQQGLFLGGFFNSVNTASVACKMYAGDPGAVISGGGAFIGTRSGCRLVDFGTSQQLRIVSVTSRALKAETVGGFRAANIKVIGGRLVGISSDTSDGGTLACDGLHLIGVTFGGTIAFAEGDENIITGCTFGQEVTLNGPETMFGTDNIVKNGMVIGASFTGSIFGQKVTTISTIGNITVTPIDDGNLIYHTATLLTNRTVTLDTTGAYLGLRYKFIRTGSGAFNLDIGGLVNLRPNGFTWCEVFYNGSAFVLIARGNTQAGTFVPTWLGSGGNPAIGNGSLLGRYQVDGQFVRIWVYMAAGSGTTFGTGNWTMTTGLSTLLPALGTASAPINAEDNSVPSYYSSRGVAVMASGADLISLYDTGGSTFWSSATPFTWATSDKFSFELRYPIV